MRKRDYDVGRTEFPPAFSIQLCFPILLLLRSVLWVDLEQLCSMVLIRTVSRVL